MMTLKRTIGVVVFGALMISACGGGDGDETVAETAESVAPAVTAEAESEVTTEPATTTTTVPDTTTTTSTTTSTTTTTTTTLPPTMPDFAGRQIADVRAELSVYNVRITEVALIDAAPAGSVIEQDPLPGERFSTSLTLTVSVAPPPVPTLVGLSIGEARDLLTEEGFTIRETEQLDEEARDGEVLAQDPAPGAENEGEVSLTVARRPVVVNLRSVTAVQNSRTSYGTFKANAVSYPDSFQIFDGYDERDLSRGFRRLVGSYGVEDTDPVATVVSIRVIGDNRILFEDSVGFGQTKELDVDVTDVLRLRIESDRLESTGTLILGSPRVLGLEGEVPDL